MLQDTVELSPFKVSKRSQSTKSATQTFLKPFSASMVIESRDRSHDDPAGPATVQSCDAVRVSVLVSVCSY